MEFFAQVLLIAVGLVHLAPGVVALSAAQARAAYGVDPANQDLTVLLRHRAVLLVLVGAAMLAGAFVEELRVPAMIAGAVSMATFIVFAFGARDANPRIRRVAQVDVVALIALAVAAVIFAVWA
ncbi:hypothetical protein GV794_14110 [Nocardia cyriacigeorgica]|uniref:Phosphopantetheine adenylyltransferase n=1 Tax=Nocardia cyriacigeorgica TaxID=135487 RepID=A0ABX0CJS9_9NOCA|nr:hypothetical protein [Nocardia cyriacigeorgica]NEW41799.1 hypothetical protein [Nocardia cyriacigeorgica]NEW56783.1 hypothetical protein [Nocardia cyriacigeorgica]